MERSAQLSKIIAGKVWKFFGGIKPPSSKNTSHSHIEELGIPSLITIPLDRHLGKGGEILVKTGEYVKTYQPLTRPGPGRLVPAHASTSGYVASIGPQVLPHPSGFTGLCLTIKPDKLDVKDEPKPLPNWQLLSEEELLDRIRMFGVEGLGGAQFQTAAKLGSAIAGDRSCEIFIVNGCECEPVATCDDRLMQEKAADIMQGIEVIKHILKPKLTLIAIEDNKPEAIAAMKQAAKDKAQVQVRVIPTVYPSGAARNLIKILTGIEIPYAAHTSDCGIVVDNVETVFAVKQAVIDGIPLIKRVITVDGGSLGRTGNALVRLGTSVRFVLNAYKLKPERHQRIILGGPFMGFTLPTIDVPLTKSATCILAPAVEEIAPEMQEQNCIRCGRCARVCPSRLVPYQMYALSKASQHKKTIQCGITDCTECGCCAYVCPSKIKLTAQFRKEKAIVSLINKQQERTQRAKDRKAARDLRLAEEEKIRQQKKKAALERIKAQQAAAEAAGTAAGKAAPAAGSPGADLNDLAARRKAALEAARARAALRKQGADGAQASAPKPAPGSFMASLDGPSLSKGNPLLAKGPDRANPLDAAPQTAAAPQDEDLPQSAQAAAGNQAQEQISTLPFNLRQGAVPKHANLDNKWGRLDTDGQHDLGKVENPPEHEIVVPKKEKKPLSYYDVPQEQTKIPHNLTRAARRPSDGN